MDGIGGWLLVYLIASVPVAAFYAAGLAGWRRDYPMWLFVTAFLVLAAPLAPLAMQLPSAPEWNIIALWAGAGSITLRVFYGIRHAARERLSRSALTILAAIASGAIGWAAMWTIYFLVSDRVAATYG